MVAILLGTGFEPVEALAPCDILRRGGVEVKLAALEGRVVEGGHGIRVEADCALSDLNVDDLEMVVLPGGLGGVHSILACDEALALVRRAYDAGKLIGAICAAPQILAKLGITDGRKATCYPGVEAVMGNAVMQDAGVVCDGAVITGRAMGSAEAFGLALLAALRGEETAQRVAQEIVSCAR